MIGMDPRGVGTSTPVQCDPDVYNQPVSLFPSTEAQFNQLASWARAFGRSCLERTGPLREPGSAVIGLVLVRGVCSVGVWKWIARRRSSGRDWRRSILANLLSTRAWRSCARLQQGAGNASVSRMLSRRATDLADEPRGPTEVEPHGPGEDKDTPGVLADAAREPGEVRSWGCWGRSGARPSGVAPPAPAPAPAGHIAKSVGNGGVNQPADVKIVADLLRAAGLVVTGDDLGPAIVRYRPTCSAGRRRTAASIPAARRSPSCSQT